MPLATASSELSAASASNSPGGSLTQGSITLESLAGVVDQIGRNMDQLGRNMVAM